MELLVENLDTGILQRPDVSYRAQSKEKALLILGCSSAAWHVTPEKVDMLRSLSKADKTNETS